MGMGIDSSHFSFLSDESGIINRKIGKLEPYVAWSQTRIYMKDGAEFNALDMSRPIHFPLSQILIHLAPLDTVLSNIDSTLIDSIKTFPVIKNGRLYGIPPITTETLFSSIAHSERKNGGSHLQNRKTIFHVRQLNPESKIQPYTTHWREQTLRANGMPVPENMTPIEETGGLEPEIIVPVIPRDTIPEIEPGWLFQVPDYINPHRNQPRWWLSFQNQLQRVPRNPKFQQ